MRAPLADHDAAQRPSAPRTGCAGALIHVEELLHLAVALGRGVVVDGRAAPLDALGEHLADGQVEAALVIRMKARGSAEWMQSGAPERLVRVDVADTGDERLVKQERLEARPAFAQAAAKRAYRELVRQRLGTVLLEQLAFVVGAQDLACLAAPVGPTRPNLRTSRKSSHRPSARSSRRWTWRSWGVPDGSTKSWPVIFTWIASTRSPDRETTSHLARRPTSRIWRPTTSLANLPGSGWRITRGQSVQTPEIVAPTTSGRSSRAIVSTSGSSGIPVRIG